MSRKSKSEGRRPSAMEARAERWLGLLLGTLFGMACCGTFGWLTGLHWIIGYAAVLGVPLLVIFGGLWHHARLEIKKMQKESDDLFTDLEDPDPGDPPEAFESGDYPTL